MVFGNLQGNMSIIAIRFLYNLISGIYLVISEIDLVELP